MVQQEPFLRDRVTAGSYWPPYTPRTGVDPETGKILERRRVFAWLTVSHKEQRLSVLDEYGGHFQCHLDEYETLRDMALNCGWVLFCRLGRGTLQSYPHLVRALHDGSATILASGKKISRSSAVCGIEWRRGRKRARIVDPDVWGFSQLVKDGVHVSPLTFLMYCRRCCDLLAIGTYDTPASLGTARISVDWSTAHRRKQWRLPRRLRALLTANPVHPRIYDIDTPACYALLRERDLRSAYATTLAGQLPLGSPCFISAGEAASHLVRSTEAGGRGQASQQVGEGLSFGQWEVSIPEPIVYSPVSRVWTGGKSPTFCLPEGCHQVPLWGEEADALEEVGCTLRWLGGWLWTDVGAPFKEFCHETNRLRQWADGSQRPILSEMLKRIPNAVVGRFNISRSCTIVPESDATEGDILFPLDWDGSTLPTELAALHVEQNRDTAQPIHWYSYIVMKVGLQIWRAQREEMQNGFTVISANIDSYRVVQPSLTFDRIEDTAAWKEFLIRDAKIEASRYIDGWKSTNGGQTWTRMIRAPGIKRE